jgi:hypothetical protein
MDIKRIGSQPSNKGPEAYFTGRANRLAVQRQRQRQRRPQRRKSRGNTIDL